MDLREQIDRRRFLRRSVAAGFGVLSAGAAIRVLRHSTAAASGDGGGPIDAMLHDLGADTLELVRRGHLRGRSAELQLVLRPFNTANYPFESTSLVPGDPRTSHAQPWDYLERVPIAVYAPGLVAPGDRPEPVTLADLAPTTATLLGVGFDAPDGGSLPGVDRPATPPKVIVTFVIDGGGWNVLQHRNGGPDPWPHLRALLADSLVFRDGRMGSFPAVTACAHATIGTGGFPSAHGITGHYLRRGGQKTTAYGRPGEADPTFLLRPTLADVWSDATGGAAWIGEVGYQIWHLGMIGSGGRSVGGVPVAVYFDEADGVWTPQNPDLYRLPVGTPGPGVLRVREAAYTDPHIDDRFDPTGPAAPCCSPPIVQDQGDLLDAIFANEPIGMGDPTSLLYVNFKAPDYTGHVYGMASERERIALAAVDAELGRLVRTLQTRFRPGEYALIVTADHGQCPPVDASGGVRLDPIQLQRDIEALHGRSDVEVVESVVPSEVYLREEGLASSGLTADAIAAAVSGYRYGDNIGRYVRHDVVASDRLHHKIFAAVLPSDTIDGLAGTDLSSYGNGIFADADPNGIPPREW